jgi:hypothetical protein
VTATKKFGAKLSDQDQNTLIQAFPGQEGERGLRLNISKIFDLKYEKALKKILQKVSVENNRAGDEPTDELGYHGKSRWARPKVFGEITECTKDEFKQIIKSDPLKLHKVMMTIRQIDKDHNGYVTKNELEDILKMFYESFLNKNLDKLINQFSSIQNKILISYMNFIEWVKGLIREDEIKSTSGAQAVKTAKAFSELSE